MTYSRLDPLREHLNYWYQLIECLSFDYSDQFDLHIDCVPEEGDLEFSNSKLICEYGVGKWAMMEIETLIEGIFLVGLVK